jgi:hypothetical protein
MEQSPDRRAPFEAVDLLIYWSEMINSSIQEDRKAERKKQEEHARALSAARKRNREEELRHLHLLATEVGVLSFYHQGDLINIRGRVNGASYALNVSPQLPPADIVKAISRKSAA